LERLSIFDPVEEKLADLADGGRMWRRRVRRRLSHAEVEE
jgi:hypothetical protein